MARSDERFRRGSPEAALPGEPALRRRDALGALAGAGVSRGSAQAEKGQVYPSEAQRYSDPSTELDVTRLTSPRVSSFLTAFYHPAASHRGAFLLYTSDRTGSLQAFRMDLKTGESKILTDAAALDAASLVLLPGERACCYFDGPVLRQGLLAEREIYRVAEGWERAPGFAVSDDGLHGYVAETKPGRSRLRQVSLLKGPPVTVLEVEGEISTPLPRPKRAQVLYRRAGEIWLVNLDGQQNRKLKTETAGAAIWTPAGRTVAYLHAPEAGTNGPYTVREHTPDENSDRLVANTSQFAAFGQNGDASVFVGASRSKASPYVLLLLRIARREFTLCEHKSSDPASVCPVFSPDSQSVFFQSDREGKPAIYRMRVEKLVEATGA